MGLLGSGIALLVAAQLFPFAVGASHGDYWNALPIVPVVIDAVRNASSSVPFAGLGAAFEFFDAAVQATGLGLSIAGSIMREREESPGPSRRYGIFSWYVVPTAAPNGIGAAVAVVNW